MKAKKILFFVDILLTAMVLWMGFNIYQTWASSKGPEKRPDTNIPGESAQEEASPKKPTSSSEYRLIINRDMFKTPRAAAKVALKPPPTRPPKIVNQERPESHLKLKGTVLEAQGGDACAIILNEKESKQDVYRLNDYVGEARIAEITSDSITLDVSGEKEVLSLSFERGASTRRVLQPSRAPMPVRRPVRRTLPQRRISQPRPAPAGIAVEENDFEDEEDLD